MANLDLWSKIVEHLNGTCSSIPEALETFECEALADDADFLGYLDDQIFECTCCGWWYPISEMSVNEGADWTCDSCSPEEEED